MIDLGTVGSIIGIGFGGITGWLQRKTHENHEFRLRMNAQDQNSALALSTKTTKIMQFTRCFLGFSAAFSIFWVPFISMWYNIPSYVAYSEDNGFFSSLWYGSTSIIWKQLPPGHAVTPDMTMAGLMILSFLLAGRFK